MARLGSLTSAVKPPRVPRGPAIAKADWDALQGALGTSLPAAYRTFLETYGTGSISKYVRVLNPFDPGDGWFEWVAYMIASDAHARAFDARSKWPSKRQLPAPPFPANPGLLPFAIWGPAALLWYWTRGEPDEWPIVWSPIGSFDHLTFELTLPAFLDRIVRGKLRDPALGVEYPTLQRGAKFVQAPKPKRSTASSDAPAWACARDALTDLVAKNQGLKFVPWKPASSRA